MDKIVNNKCMTLDVYFDNIKYQSELNDVCNIMHNCLKGKCAYCNNEIIISNYGTSNPVVTVFLDKGPYDEITTDAICDCLFNTLIKATTPTRIKSEVPSDVNEPHITFDVYFDETLSNIMLNTLCKWMIDIGSYGISISNYDTNNPKISLKFFSELFGLINHEPMIDEIVKVFHYIICIASSSYPGRMKQEYTFEKSKEDMKTANTVNCESIKNYVEKIKNTMKEEENIMKENKKVNNKKDIDSKTCQSFLSSKNDKELCNTITEIIESFSNIKEKSVDLFNYFTDPDRKTFVDSISSKEDFNDVLSAAAKNVNNKEDVEEKEETKDEDVTVADICNCLSNFLDSILTEDDLEDDDEEDEDDDNEDIAYNYNDDEEEPKLIRNADSYIKVDGTPKQFAGGAIRFSKEGKGRYDLIPASIVGKAFDMMDMYINAVTKNKMNYSRELTQLILSLTKYKDIYCDTLSNAFAIYVMTKIIVREAETNEDIRSQIKHTKLDLPVYNVGSSIKSHVNTYISDIDIINETDDSVIVTPMDMNIYFEELLEELAIHYENGAKIYGENNWKKGIPSSSFRDSALRHFKKFISGDDDEKHFIAMIWNIIGEIYNSKKNSDNE